MSKRSLFLIAAFGLLANLAFVTPSQAGTIPFSYTVSIASNTVSVSSIGGGSGSLTPSTINGSGLANPAPSTAAASDAIGGYTYTYSGGSYPPNAIFISGVVTYDVKVTDTTSGDSATFVVMATFGNIVSSNTVPPTPALGGTGASQVLGSYKYDINATSIGTNSHVPGTAIYIGFEYTAVPEPASMALLGIGMAGFFAFRRFFNKRNSEV